MKKVLFLLLFLLVLGAANVSAQVRIGGDEAPNDAAVLDLNVDDDTNNGTKGLALPRVSLDNITATLDGTTANIDGMMVYNTGGTLTAGIYFWNGSRWVALQTYGLWARTVTCPNCAALTVNTGMVITWSEFGAPSWASFAACWSSGIYFAPYYTLTMGNTGVYVFKYMPSSGEPSIRLFCWGPEN